MSIKFEKNQIVSSTDLIRSFGTYLETDLCNHDIFIFKRNTPEAVLVAYDRYERMKNQLTELKDLLEQLTIQAMVEERKDSPEKELSLDKLQKKYGL